MVIYIKNLIVLGTSLGNEGKEKITSYLAKEYDILVRYQSVSEKVNKVILHKNEYYLKILPKAIIDNNIMVVLSSGMIIDPKVLCNEISFLETNGINVKLRISEKAQVLMPYNIILDSELEKVKNEKLGVSGLFSASSDKINKLEIDYSNFTSDKFIERLKYVIDIKNESREKTNKPLFNLQTIYSEYLVYANILKKYVTNTSVFVDDAIVYDNSVLFESTISQFEGMENGLFPYDRPTYANISFAPLSIGIKEGYFTKKLGVSKAYVSARDNQYIPSQMQNAELVKKIYNNGYEYNSDKNTYNKIGWFDLVMAKEAIRVNGIKYIALTMLDALTGIEKIKIAISYNLDGKKINYIPNNLDDYKRVVPNYIELPGWSNSLKGIKTYKKLPKNLKIYLKKIESLLNVKIAMISIGKDTNDIIILKNI